jgi:hypothetical protein
MKTWFAKFRSSLALDNQTLSMPASNRLSAEARRFAQQAASLEQALKKEPVETPLPPSLHESIMRAVRAAEQRRVPVSNHGLRWIPAFGLAAVALIGVWLAIHDSSRHAPMPANTTLPFGSAATVLELKGKVANDLPASVMAPLTEELAHINRDMAQTAQFLLAALP